MLLYFGILFPISHVAHSFLKKTSILENTAKSLPTYFFHVTYLIGDIH